MPSKPHRPLSTSTKKKKTSQHAVDAALDLPPLADQHPTTLRLLAALAALSDAVYSATVADVGRELPIDELSSSSSAAAAAGGGAARPPAAATATATATATARLLHFRPAGGHGSSHHHHRRRHNRSPLEDVGRDDDDDDDDEEDLESPQQWGLWRLRLFPRDGDNDGGRETARPPFECLVVAFRGTASPADVLIDAAIAPEALAPLGAYSSSRSRSGEEGGGRRGNADESSSSSSGDGGGGDERGQRGGAAAKRRSRPAPPPPLHAHHGFLTGARRHLRSILRLLSCHGGARGGGEGSGNGKAASSSAAADDDFTVPVFFTGHSLGGGYAAAAALDLLSSGSAKRVFGAASTRAAEAEARRHHQQEQQQQQQRRRRGTTTSAAPPPPLPPLLLLRGGVVTFGAPPVFHCPPGHAEAAHSRLDELMEAAGLAARRMENNSGGEEDSSNDLSRLLLPRFAFGNVVTAGDPVPRLLGTGFSGVARLAAAAVPSIDAIRAAAEAYRPLGTLLFDISAGTAAGAGSTAASGTAIAAVVAAGLASPGFSGLRLAGAPMPLDDDKRGGRNNARGSNSNSRSRSPQRRRRRRTEAAAAACFHALGDAASECRRVAAASQGSWLLWLLPLRVARAGVWMPLLVNVLPPPAAAALQPLRRTAKPCGLRQQQRTPCAPGASLRMTEPLSRELL